MFDREHNAYQAARYLLEHGHKRIGIGMSRPAKVATWYDRFMRTCEFFQIDAEFRKKNVRFKTLHDATSTDLATGHL